MKVLEEETNTRKNDSKSTGISKSLENDEQENYINQKINMVLKREYDSKMNDYQSGEGGVPERRSKRLFYMTMKKYFMTVFIFGLHLGGVYAIKQISFKTVPQLDMY